MRKSGSSAGSGNILGGESAVIRHYAANTTDALIARAGFKCAFGYNPMSVGAWKGTRPSTRMGALAMLRGKLDEVRTKVAKHRRATGKTTIEVVSAVPIESMRRSQSTAKRRTEIWAQPPNSARPISGVNAASCT